MNILFVKEDNSLTAEFNSYMNELGAVAYFANDILELKTMLSQNSFDLVIIPLSVVSDVLSRYIIEDNLNHTKVVVTVDDKDAYLSHRETLLENFDSIRERTHSYFKNQKLDVDLSMNFMLN